MRWNFNTILLFAGNLIAIFVPLLGYLFGEHSHYFIQPLPDYTGPCEIVQVGIRPQFFLITAIGSVLALVGAFMSLKKRSARTFMGLGNLLRLIHSVIGLFGYYEIITIVPWLWSGLTQYQPKPVVYTMFFSITTLGLVSLIIGGIMYSDRIMAFVNTYIR
jgi:predicted membrane channel-forming protein YqfA (hemolysin III family)